MQQNSLSERRRVNIQKTKALQKELFGVESIAQKVRRQAQQQLTHNRKRKRDKKLSSSGTDDASRRKSARLQGKQYNFEELPLYTPSERVNPGKKRVKANNKSTSYPLPDDSSKSLSANIDNLNEHWLTKYIDVSLGGPGNQAKRAVMNLASSSGKKPRFNKMSGIQEFNNAILLFVNIDSSNNYNNVFSDEGRYMTWFAQPTQSEDSPVIRRLIDTREHSSKDRVGLFVRPPGQPYVYLGELTYVSHNPKTKPVAFTWELRHFHDIKQYPDVAELLRN